jgi:hypothetical protein
MISVKIKFGEDFFIYEFYDDDQDLSREFGGRLDLTFNAGCCLIEVNKAVGRQDLRGKFKRSGLSNRKGIGMHWPGDC